MFGKQILQKLYEKNDALRAHGEIPSKLPNSFSSEGNATNLHNKTADTEMGKQAQSAAEDDVIDENPDLERRQDVGCIKPKKKRCWSNILAKLFCSCYRGKNNAD